MLSGDSQIVKQVRCQNAIFYGPITLRAEYSDIWEKYCGESPWGNVDRDQSLRRGDHDTLSQCSSDDEPQWLNACLVDDAAPGGR